jgi:transcription elongation GreA/GreB family factor
MNQDYRFKFMQYLYRMIKKELLNIIENIVSERIQECEKSILDLNESLKNETKSSAGDKYETSVEMLNIELRNINKNLMMNKLLLDDLYKIDSTVQNDSVELGSIVSTQQGQFFISISFGKIMYLNEEYYAISRTAPLAQALSGKKTGDKIIFQNKEIEILQIQ